MCQQAKRMHRSMFGHVLRMLDDTPAQLALQFAVADTADTGAEIAGTPPT